MRETVPATGVVHERWTDVVESAEAERPVTDKKFVSAENCAGAEFFRFAELATTVKV